MKNFKKLTTIATLTLAANFSFSSALANDGEGYMWGENAVYELISPSVAKVWLTGITDKGQDWTDGDNPDGLTYSLPDLYYYVAGEGYSCQLELLSVEKVKDLDQNGSYRWYYNPVINTDPTCPIQQIISLPEAGKNDIDADYLTSSEARDYSFFQGFTVFYKPGFEFKPNEVIYIRQVMYDTLTHNRLSDEFTFGNNSAR